LEYPVHMRTRDLQENDIEAMVGFGHVEARLPSVMEAHRTLE